jgi:internalin A
MTRDELSALIDQAAREGWTELDLRDQEISELPPEIGQLTNLQKLSIGAQKWGEVEGASRNVRRLLDTNSLASVPPEIGRLTNLQSLDLSNNKLIGLPAEIGQLISLQQFNLGSNQLTAIPPEIGQLTSLTSLDLSSNRLMNVPWELGLLTQLQLLNLSNNQLRVVSPEIGQLINLQELQIGGNEIATIPDEIGRLSNLKKLSFRGNPILSLPPGIGRLRNLQMLDLIGNLLVTIPPEAANLTTLQQLYLGNCQLETAPSEFSYMTDLRVLHLVNTGLRVVPPRIGKLSNLISLALDGNHIEVLPLEVCYLTNLRSLSLGSNTLASIPSQIGQLTVLTELELSSNQLTAVPSEIGQLTSLRRLDLSRNQIIILPPTMRRLTELEELRLYGNPLPLPPELLGDWPNPGDPQTILDTYFQASHPLREAKLLLVGEGSVGKSSLVERLLWNRPPSDSGKTIGVDIHQWRVESEKLNLKSEALAVPDARRNTQDAIRLNVWDFGGQEIYHATHQFFLTHRSLYLVVLESRKDESANRLEYWLRHVQSFAGDAPIIVVANKSDQHRMTLDERGLMLKYPSIQSIIHTSCVTGAGIPQLRQAIETALATMPHINDWIPLTWFAVKEKLADLDKDYLPYESYVELCVAEGVNHEAAQRTLARFLHDLGAALNFQDDQRLAGTNVLNPEWVTGGIYHILNADFLQGQGILHLRDLDRILDVERYPHHKQPFLLDIMRKFELCVPLGDGQRYLIPGLLPKERPDFEWPDAGAVALEYRYAILPAAVIWRLMVRLHHHIWTGSDGRVIRWRNGLVLVRDGCRALIVTEPSANRLTIALDGPFPHRRQLLSIIRAELAEIHTSFARLEAEEWVPLPGKPDAAIQYRALLNLEARRIFTHYDPANDMEIDVRALLDGIEMEAERDVRVLANKLREQFSRGDLRQLAFDLGVDHEDLPGDTKTDLARELTLDCQRRGRLAELARVVERERP